jgi:hypothetical protein
VKNEVEDIVQYQQKWKKHGARKDDDHLPLSENSDLVRPKWRWEEQEHLQDQEEHALTDSTSTAYNIDNDDDDDDDDADDDDDSSVQGNKWKCKVCPEHHEKNKLYVQSRLPMQ